MEGNSLFNPGFLGGNFNWWVGQIPDEDTWRDNINPAVYSDPSDVQGWGFRYKVRIMGVHDWGEESIPSEQLPWAQVMYPVTAGGGQAGAFATPALRQGNMVFGFFMDQQEQQIPVIMGVLGNNAQTPKPRIGSAEAEKVNNNGNITRDGYSRAPKEEDAKPADGDVSLVKDNSGTTNQTPAAPHLQNVDTKKKLIEQGVLHSILNPHDVPGSAMSAIQTALDNLINYIDGWLSTITSYSAAVGAVISTLEDIEGMLEKIACEIAKYMKIILDKVMEYTLKMLNKTLAPIVSSIPSTMRYMFGDIKEIITELILCLYNKMMKGMCEMIAGILKGAFDLEGLKEMAEESIDDDITTLPEVPVCYAEDLVGKIIAANKQNIDDANNSILNNINAFVSDIQEELAGLTDEFEDILSLPGDIAGSIGSALSFTNFSLNVYGCELSPDWTSALYWSIGQGGSSHSDSQQASPQAVAEQANTTTLPGSSNPDIPYLEARNNAPPQTLGIA
jgi:hypothetical protein